MNQQPDQHWIVTADSRRAALYSLRRTPGGELHADRQRELLADQGTQERHRPQFLGGGERRGSTSRAGAHAGMQPASLGHQAEEMEKRFARRVKGWLDHARMELGAEPVLVFAAPRLLGLLREQIGPNARLHDGELSNLSTGELAAHPTVRSAIDQAAASRRREVSSGAAPRRRGGAT